MRCSVCESPKRDEIEKWLASGVPSRTIADQCPGLSRSAILRHEQHLSAAVRKAGVKRLEHRERVSQSRWVERLEEAYESACQGIARAEVDPENWHQGARFLSVAAKLIEAGLKVDGVIDGGREMVTVNADQVLILPLPGSSRPQIEVDSHSLTLQEDGTYSDEEPIS